MLSNASGGVSGVEDFKTEKIDAVSIDECDDDDTDDDVPLAVLKRKAALEPPRNSVKDKMVGAVPLQRKRKAESKTNASEIKKQKKAQEKKAKEIEAKKAKAKDEAEEKRRAKQERENQQRAAAKVKTAEKKKAREAVQAKQGADAQVKEAHAVENARGVKEAHEIEKAREAKSTKTGPKEEVVGKRVAVFWPVDDDWYNGTVASYATDTGMHTIKYDDDEVEEVSLDTGGETWKRIDGRTKKLKAEEPKTQKIESDSESVEDAAEEALEAKTARQAEEERQRAKELAIKIKKVEQKAAKEKAKREKEAQQKAASKAKAKAAEQKRLNEATQNAELQKRKEEELVAVRSQVLVEQVQGILVALSRRREDSFSLDRLLQLVNTDATAEFPTEARELQGALTVLEAKGRIMYSSGVVYIV
jgi:hypothetical protein